MNNIKTTYNNSFYENNSINSEFEKILQQKDDKNIKYQRIAQNIKQPFSFKQLR